MIRKSSIGTQCHGVGSKYSRCLFGNPAGSGTVMRISEISISSISSADISVCIYKTDHTFTETSTDEFGVISVGIANSSSTHAGELLRKVRIEGNASVTFNLPIELKEGEVLLTEDITADSTQASSITYELIDL